MIPERAAALLQLLLDLRARGILPPRAGGDRSTALGPIGDVSIERPFQASISRRNAARDWLESELWPNGPVCRIAAPSMRRRCYSAAPSPARTSPIPSRSAPPAPASTSATPAASRSRSRSARSTSASHIPLHKWLAATHLMMASKKGMSALSDQPHARHHATSRRGSCATASARACARRNSTDAARRAEQGGRGRRNLRRRQRDQQARQQAHSMAVAAAVGKEPVVALVERDGRVRSRHMSRRHRARRLTPVLRAQVDRKSYLMTDESARLHADRRRVRRPRHRQPLDRGIRARRLLAHQHGRGLFLDPQARHRRHLSPRQRSST